MDANIDHAIIEINGRLDHENLPNLIRTLGRIDPILVPYQTHAQHGKCQLRLSCFNGRDKHDYFVGVGNGHSRSDCPTNKSRCKSVSYPYELF